MLWKNNFQVNNLLYFIEKKNDNPLFIFKCRDAAIYATSALRSGLDSVMNVIADGLFRPNITDEEVSVFSFIRPSNSLFSVWWLIKLNVVQLADAQQTIAFELESLKSKPEQDLLLMDMIHAVIVIDFIKWNFFVIFYFFFSS